jgi:hypothetical protein
VISLDFNTPYSFADYYSARAAVGVNAGDYTTNISVIFKSAGEPDFSRSIEVAGVYGWYEIEWSRGDYKISQSRASVWGGGGTVYTLGYEDIPWLDRDGVTFQFTCNNIDASGAQAFLWPQTVFLNRPKVTVTYVDGTGATVTEEWEIYDTLSYRGLDGTPPYESDLATLSATSWANSDLLTGLTDFVYSSSDTSVAIIDVNELKMLKYDIVTISAYQPGNDRYEPGLGTWTIIPPGIPAAQTISVDAPSVMSVGQYAEFSYSASSGLAVTVRSVSPEIVEITADGKLHALLPGGSVLMFDQAGNTDWADASETYVVVVDGLAQTVTFNPIPSLKLGDTATLSATSSAGLEVIFTSSDPSVASVSGTTITIKSQGLANITATAAVSPIYNPAAATQQVVVGQSGQAIYFPAVPAVPYGAGTISLVASSTSGLPFTTTSSNTGVATVIDGTTLQISGVGSTTITIAQPGNGYWLPATPQQQLLTVTKGDPGLEFSRPGSPVALGGRILLSATAKSGQPVRFSATGAVRLDGEYLVADSVGSGSVTALVDSTALYNSIAITYGVAVGKLTQSINFPPLGIFSRTDFPFLLGASASSGLPVEFDSSNPNVADVAGGRVTITGVGVATITASQNGDSVFEAAPSVAQEIAVERAGQAIAFRELEPVPYDGSPVSFGLSGSAPGGLVEFRCSNSAVAVVENLSQLVVNGLGVARIIATQAGNADYLPAVAVQSVIVLPVKPSIQATRGVLDNEPHNSLAVSAATSAPAISVQAPAFEDREAFSSTAASPVLSCGGSQIQISILDTEEHLSNSISATFSGASFNILPLGADESPYSGITASSNYAGASPTMTLGAELDLVEYRSWLASAASSANSVVARYDGRNEFEVYFAPVAYEPVGFLKWTKSGSTGAIQQYRTNEDNLQIKGRIAL